MCHSEPTTHLTPNDWAAQQLFQSPPEPFPLFQETQVGYLLGRLG